MEQKDRPEAEIEFEALDEIPAGVGVFDVADSTITMKYLNDGFYRMIRARREDRARFFEKGTINSVYPEDRAGLLSEALQSIKEHRTFDCRFRNLDGEGRYIWIGIRASHKPLDEKTERFYASYYDVDQYVSEPSVGWIRRIRMREEEKHAAEAANIAKTEFLSRMSHDMRTPLNGVIGMAYLAQKENNPPFTADCLTKINTCARFLLSLINNILDMAKVENGNIELHYEPAPVGYFDCILMDLRMPVLDGLGAAKAIRAAERPDAETVPIFAMTADAFSDDIKKCLDAGMNGHIAKPIDPEKLYSVLRNTLAG